MKKRKTSKIVQKFLADSPYVKVMELKINLSIEGIVSENVPLSTHQHRVTVEELYKCLSLSGEADDPIK